MRYPCDFYIMGHDGKLEWIGSSKYNGDIISIPIPLLLQTNQAIFISEVEEFLYKNEGFSKYEGKCWPWSWEDSRGTNYTYIYRECTGKVYMSIEGGRLLDPIKILQGMDEIGADVGFGLIEFPKMIKEKTKEYGSKPAMVI